MRWGRNGENEMMNGAKREGKEEERGRKKRKKRKRETGGMQSGK